MSRKKRMVGIQVSSARSLLGITQKELGEKTQLSAGKIKMTEKHKYTEFGTIQNINKLEDFFEKAGVEFYEDDKRIGSVILKNKIKE